MNAIEIKNLHFSYGKENVLDGVSLCLKEGRLAILAGENGAGKSTLLRLLLGELPIGESHKGDQEEGSGDGSIEILGQDIRQFKDWSSISYVPQNGMGGWKDFPASVEEIVRANLYKQIGLFRFAGKKEPSSKPTRSYPHGMPRPLKSCQECPPAHFAGQAGRTRQLRNKCVSIR